jgi:Rod binding domain-containing protein
VITGGTQAVDSVAQAQGAKAIPETLEKTEKAARQFEGMLMGLLFQTMRKTVEPSGLFGDSGQSRSTYEYLMDQAVVERAVSGGRGWGLAERLQACWSQGGKVDAAQQSLPEG